MAEFVYVLQQFNRMCKANAGCFNCPLHGHYGVSDRCSIGAFVNDSERIEREVMEWAAEHPEPVYPTWGEWLNEQAVVIKIIDNGALIFEPDAKMRQPIPADIAQKLGIEPKK